MNSPASSPPVPTTTDSLAPPSLPKAVLNSPHVVPFDGSFELRDAPTVLRPDTGRKLLKRELRGIVKQIAEHQRMLYADDRFAVLMVFQAMDAAGKDGTIRAVLSGVNPAGCQVKSFKQPSSLELDHDYLWRTASRLPERGRIGVFNRSYYEEVLVVRVHPELLAHQKLPHRPRTEEELGRFWRQRYEAIRCHERHLAQSGTLVLKFWLNVSKDEQRRRFLSRLQELEKNWKFSASDVRERRSWDAYMEAYEAALRSTSTPWAPWFAIPADNKRAARVAVAEILRDTLAGIDIHYPIVPEVQRQRFDEIRTALESEP